MNLREAMLRAADRFESNARKFDFCNPCTPTAASTACYLGEIAFQLGMKSGLICGTDSDDGCCVDIVGVPFVEWKDRMERLSDVIDARCQWNLPGPHNAVLLRLYADLFHSAAPIVYPKWNEIAATRAVPADAVSEDVRVSA